ncbi:hypothetical protein [Elizabethkingia anophelis]|uniref:hypothetical protein n=1 Tax=Elizabethkingia anophelis TaxID=1117645 RepID=UPI0021B27826|nr:hypothetical protein [Elizabethkingia anophelis]
MKTLFLASGLVFFLFSCKKTEQNFQKEDTQISQRLHFKEDKDNFRITSGKFDIELKNQFSH